MADRLLSEVLAEMVAVDDLSEQMFATKMFALLREHVLDLEARLVVTHEMVERAWQILDDGGAVQRDPDGRGGQWDLDLPLVRAALEAALNGDGGENRS